MSLTALALTALPLAAQKALAQHPDARVRSALVACNLTHTDICDRLVADKNPLVKRVALIRTTNSVLVNKIGAAGLPYRTGRRIEFAMRAANNPRVAPELLADMLNAVNSSLALRAYCNPSTSETAKRLLTPERATKMISRGGRRSRNNRQVRAFELVLNNLWMMEEPLQWDNDILTAIAGLPEATKDTLQAVGKKLGGGRTKTIAHNHPTYNDIDIHTATINDLSELKNAASDIEATRRPNFDKTAAHNIVNRRYSNPEPHVIGRIVNRYGASILYEKEPHQDRWADKDLMQAVAWVARALFYIDDDFKTSIQDMENAANILGDSERDWETYISLLPHWHDTHETAARAARQLH